MKEHLNNVIKGKIITYHDRGWTNIQIAKDLNLNKNTVTLWTNRYRNYGTIEEIKKSGRKRKTTKDQDIKIIEIVYKKRKRNQSQLYD